MSDVFSLERLFTDDDYPGWADELSPSIERTQHAGVAISSVVKVCPTPTGDSVMDSIDALLAEFECSVTSTDVAA